MKKDFFNNPAFNQLTGYTENENKNAEKIPEIKSPEATETKKDDKPARTRKPAVKTFQPEKKETKSKRLQLLLKPTVFEKLQEKAKEFDISVNELVNQIIEKSNL